MPRTAPPQSAACSVILSFRQWTGTAACGVKPARCWQVFTISSANCSTAVSRRFINNLICSLSLPTAVAWGLASAVLEAISTTRQDHRASATPTEQSHFHIIISP